MTPTRLEIPRGTRLETVWRVVLPNGTVEWHAVTACPERNAPFHRMLGTSLIMRADGSATRQVLRPDDTVSLYEVMPAVKGDDNERQRR